MNTVITGAARSERQTFFALSALLFSACATATLLWNASMSNMGEMPMPGGWTMSMLWMRMPGQTWLGLGAAFLGMWTAMMVAMMLPSLAPVMWRWVEAVGELGDGAVAGTASRMRGKGGLAALVAAGYFCVWIALGVAVFSVGAALAALAMNESCVARAVPIAAGVVVIAAGALQFTSWRMHHLTLCRELPCARQAPSSFESRAGEKDPDRKSPAPGDPAAALKSGLRLGLHCSLSSVGLTGILLVVGLMDLRAMAAITAAITVERLAPGDRRVAYVIGAVVLVAGTARVISAA